MRIVDLSFEVTNNMLVYPTDPPVKIIRLDTMSTLGVNLTQLEMGSHTGTHLDAPLHFIPSAKAANEVDLSKCVGEAVLLLMPKGKGEDISATDFKKFEEVINREKRIVVKTGWFKKWGEKGYFEDFPLVNEKGAKWLVEREIYFFGTDTPAATSAGGHRVMLEKEVVIAEALNLANLDASKFFIIALPLKLNAADGSPIRAVAIIGK